MTTEQRYGPQTEQVEALLEAIRNLTNEIRRTVPEIVVEVQLRYDASGGFLPDEDEALATAPALDADRN